MSYLAARDSAVGQIRAALLPVFPNLTVEAHPGVFTEATIKRDAQRAPAILTSLVRAEDGTHKNSLSFVSWVLHRASSEDLLYDGALKIISALIPAIRNADFNAYIKDTAIQAECLYTGALDTINVTMWAVKWELALGDRAFIREIPDDLGELESVHGTAIVGQRA